MPISQDVRTGIRADAVQLSPNLSFRRGSQTPVVCGNVYLSDGISGFPHLFNILQIEVEDFCFSA